MMFRPPSLLAPRIVPTAAITAAGQLGLLRLGLSCFVASTRSRYANRPKTGNWRYGDLHPAKLWFCRLLQSPERGPSPARSGPASPMLSCSRTAGTWRRGSASCRRTISTGGKVKQKGLSKKGDRYLRSLLVTGAMAVVRQAQIRPDKNPGVTKLLGRMSAKQAAIAIANKTARIAWAIMVHGGVYDAGYRAPQYRAEACAAAG